MSSNFIDGKVFPWLEFIALCKCGSLLTLVRSSINHDHRVIVHFTVDDDGSIIFLNGTYLCDYSEVKFKGSHPRYFKN